MDRLITIFGPSASGKDTLLESLNTSYNFKRIVNCTTRNPRPNEIESKDYYFIDESLHCEYIKNGRYITHNKSHGRSYGVLKSELTNAWSENKNPVGHFGINDLLNLWGLNYLDQTSIALLPPSFDIWLLRMFDRLSSEAISNEEILTRYFDSINEIDFILNNKNRFLPIITRTKDFSESKMQLILSGEKVELSNEYDEIEIIYQSFKNNSYRLEEKF